MDILRKLLHRLRPNRQDSADTRGDDATGLILIADDQGTNRTLLVRLLNMLGRTAESAGNGREALEKWRTGRYALLITDCQMPELDGYALTQRIREDEAEQGRPRMPIFAWTSTPSAGDLERILKSGMDGVLAKPVELEALGQLLKQHLSPNGAVHVVTPSAPSMPASSPPILDEMVLARYSGGDRAVEQEILAEFETSSEADIGSVQEALTRGDPALVAQFCHRLKGASRMVGASRVSAACAQLEQDGRAGDWKAIQSHQAVLFAELDKLRKVLEER